MLRQILTLCALVPVIGGKINCSRRSLIVEPYISAASHAGLQSVAGPFFEKNEAQTVTMQTILLSETLIPPGVVYKIAGYCTMNRNATIQIWRHINEVVYELIMEKPLIPTTVPGYCGVSAWTNHALYSWQPSRLSFTRSPSTFSSLTKTDLL
jgi:hypothetical protein